MLRSEHVIARLSRGRVVPHRLSPSNPSVLEAAAKTIDLYASRLGGRRGDLEAALAALEEEEGPRLDVRRGFKVVRAFGKLLEERAEYATPATTDPYTLRTRLFELASALPEPPVEEAGLLGSPTRGELLDQVSNETGLEDPTALMFADRKSEQVLAEFAPPEPEDLVARYNVAQAQVVLYAARELTIDLGAKADARLVFHYIKSLALIHRLEPREGNDGGYRVRLDGPLSLFGPTRKYGLKIAKLLPALLLTEPWTLSATVDWRGRDATLELTSGDGALKSHYAGPKTDEEQDEVLAAFTSAFERARDTRGWTLSPGKELLDFPEQRSVLVPDFTLKRGDETVHLEVLGFWSRRTLVERAALLRTANAEGRRILVAASENLGPSKGALEEAVRGGVVPFKGRLAVKGVLAALE